MTKPRPTSAATSLAQFKPPKEFLVYHGAAGQTTHVNHMVDGQLVKQIRAVATPTEAAKPA